MQLVIERFLLRLEAFVVAAFVAVAIFSAFAAFALLARFVFLAEEARCQRLKYLYWVVDDAGVVLLVRVVV